MINKIRAIQSSNKKPSILVIGDLMIDHYIVGSASRLSPEAPVPIVNVKNESVTLGGAGNVVQNLVALGARVTVAGVIGNDAAGTQIIEILTNEGVETHAIIKDDSRPTTLKTRVLAGSHQLVRIDRETVDEVSGTVADKLMNILAGYMSNADMVVLSDYNKGLFSPALTQRLITEANNQGKKVIIDPKGLNYEKYKGAYIIKPNRKELAEAAKTERINSLDSLKQAAKVIFEQTGTEYLVVTLSEEGMVILSELTHKLLPVKATEVFDVTGAGDTVLATIAYFIAAGLTIEEACELANHAAAIVIRHVGSATTTIDEIINDMEKN
ncbi:D-glycero-beta-D-manno-heptose-7-phosphate kinase [Mucilaginibacter pocheonensis]|uniref:D-beta-D-heptose 7-phosphate kinase/D-beta-D-heptose 1-phosphate adenosyltransferase n=1 Tax=Mucilaginibacter pocheonensis TaxID=398050 RepID=A0ABU1T8X8_9SPHI|nr:D-glycero-beta-D-manno-heptose-7-phosphate kinase [Mucilaginibacter pocheonensis]MDR6941311.1 D-beta-D-heptose 7-phosphate kinase/D-beta-D-heptose 1-phosphate adenosyltransferase [Mucilaginibacter pocheonensis]